MDECIMKQECLRTFSLNITALVSAAVKIEAPNTIRGLADSIEIAEIRLIDKIEEVVVDLETLSEIIGNLLPAYMPQINQVLQEGYPLPIDPSKMFNVSMVYADTHQSYLTLAVKIDT